MGEDGATKGGTTEGAPGGGEPEAPPAGAARGRRGRSILEGAVTDAIRRGVEAGWDRLSKGEGGAALRSALGELKVPREVAAYVAGQLGDTKNAILKVAAEEIRRFLETSRFAEELSRLLTTLQFEIRTTVRFVPNADGKQLRPKVSSQARLRRRTDREPDAG